MIQKMNNKLGRLLYNKYNTILQRVIAITILLKTLQ